MSFILDALKKSETERQQQGPSDFANVPSTAESTGAPRWLWVLGLLLAVNLVVLLGVLLSDDEAEPVEPTTQVSRAEPAPAEETPFSERIREAQQRESATRTSAETGPEPAAGPGFETSSEPVSRSAAETPPVAASQARPQPEFTLAALPTASELQANGVLQIANLHLDIHVYSELPDERFVFINMVKHRERSRLAEGPVVHEITPEGVVLDYSGTLFLLPRE